MKSRMRGISLLELAFVGALIGILAWVLIGRLAALQSEARGVQLRMGAAAAMANARLLQLKCPGEAEPACLAQALSATRRAATAGPQASEPSQPSRNAGPMGRLYAIASASGLTQHVGMGPNAWRWRELDAQRLELQLGGVNECRFRLRWDHGSTAAVVEDVSDRC